MALGMPTAPKVRWVHDGRFAASREAERFQRRSLSPIIMHSYACEQRLGFSLSWLPCPHDINLHSKYASLSLNVVCACQLRKEDRPRGKEQECIRDARDKFNLGPYSGTVTVSPALIAIKLPGLSIWNAGDHETLGSLYFLAVPRVTPALEICKPIPEARLHTCAHPTFSTAVTCMQACVNCGATKTPLWRCNVDGVKSLCNR